MAQIIPFPADAEEPELEALSREALLALAQELREKLAALDAREPEDMMSKAYERWGERHEALEDELDDLLDQNEMDGPVFKIKDDPRITRVGKFIRKTSLDELPQLWNILKGDMSIVGPRPALPREVEQYGDYEKQRLYVTPGLSCYWQIAPHRNDLSFEEWMDLDVKYVKERSFWVDWKIIFKTFKVCLLGRGE